MNSETPIWRDVTYVRNVSGRVGSNSLVKKLIISAQPRVDMHRSHDLTCASGGTNDRPNHLSLSHP